MSFGDRSDALVRLLAKLDDRQQSFVLVGGYAVSTFETRFSTDLDVVVAPEERAAFESFLEVNGFEQTEAHAKEWFYATEVVEYEKRLTPTQPIGFDLLINGLGCRQTEAQWSFDYLQEHSSERTVHGQTESTTVRVGDGSILAAAKLHSARETDVRDVVAIAEAIDLDSITPHLRRGDVDALQEQLERCRDILDNDDFAHGFRSDFGASSISTETVEQLEAYLETRIADLS